MLRRRARTVRPSAAEQPNATGCIPHQLKDRCVGLAAGDLLARAREDEIDVLGHRESREILARVLGGEGSSPCGDAARLERSSQLVQRGRDRWQLGSVPNCNGHHQLAPGCAREALPKGDKVCQIVSTERGNEHDPVRDRERGGHLPSGRLRRRIGIEIAHELAIVLEDALLKLLQRRTGFDAQLVAETAAGVLIGVERLRLPALPVQGQHQMGSQPLAKRLFADELLQFGHESGRRSDRQIGLDAAFDRNEPELVEPGDGRGGKVLVGELAERIASPEFHGRSELL